MSETISLFRSRPQPPAEETVFRPAAYGILFENQHVLLQRDSQSGLWRPVGSVLEDGQTPLQALCSHFRAVVQFSPRPGPLVFMEERRRLEEDGRRWLLSHLYYLVYRPSGLAAAERPNGSAAQQASWLSIHELDRDQMEFGYMAVHTALRRLEHES